MPKLKFIVFFCFLLIVSSCGVTRNDGWAVDFRYELDKKRYNKVGAGRGWATNFNSRLSPARYNKADIWASAFKPHPNVERYCKNKGWEVDFRSNLKPGRFQGFNNNFFVLPGPKFEALRFNDSFSTSSKKKSGGFVFSKKDRAVKQKWQLRFKDKPRTSDSFGPHVKKKEYRDNVYNKKKKTVTKRKKLFKSKKEKPYKRRDDLELDLFQFKP